MIFLLQEDLVRISVIYEWGHGWIQKLDVFFHPSGQNLRLLIGSACLFCNSIGQILAATGRPWAMGMGPTFKFEL